MSISIINPQKPRQLVLELRKDINGTGLAIFVIGSVESIRIPLGQQLSEQIERMIRMERIQLLDAPNKRRPG